MSTEVFDFEAWKCCLISCRNSGTIRSSCNSISTDSNFARASTISSSAFITIVETSPVTYLRIRNVQSDRQQNRARKGWLKKDWIGVPEQCQADNHEHGAVQDLHHVLRHNVANRSVASHRGAHPKETDEILLPNRGPGLHPELVVVYDCNGSQVGLDLVPADAAPWEPVLHQQLIRCLASKSKSTTSKFTIRYLALK